jgi:hypothetical protein
VTPVHAVYDAESYFWDFLGDVLGKPQGIPTDGVLLFINDLLSEVSDWLQLDPDQLRFDLDPTGPVLGKMWPVDRSIHFQSGQAEVPMSTVLHELAHWIVGGWEGHNHIFREKMASLVRSRLGSEAEDYLVNSYKCFGLAGTDE